MYVKGSAHGSENHRTASYAEGGAVLGRAKDFKKEPSTRFGLGGTKTPGVGDGDFLDGKDRFTGRDNATDHTNDEGWAKGSKGKIPAVRSGDTKKAPAVKPRS